MWAQLAAKEAPSDTPARPIQIVGGGTISAPKQETRLGMQLVEPSCKATHDQFAMFVRGVEAILLQWTALHLVALHHDSDAMQFVHDEILEWYWNDGEVLTDELEVYFEDFFAKCSVMLEDNSENEVADAIHKVYYEVCHNKFDIVVMYEERLHNYRKANVLGQSTFGGEWEGGATGGMVERVDDNGAGEAEDEEDAPCTEAYSRNATNQSVHNLFSRAGANSGFFYN